MIAKQDSCGLAGMTKPVLFVGVPEFKPFVKQILRNAEALAELFYGAKVCKVLPQKTQNKEQADPGSHNGRIIEWRDPVSNAKIFELDEDFRYGAHYHAMMVEWNGKHGGLHYLPGSPVPEPWNSIYFGG